MSAFRLTKQSHFTRNTLKISQSCTLLFFNLISPTRSIPSSCQHHGKPNTPLSRGAATDFLKGRDSFILGPDAGNGTRRYGGKLLRFEKRELTNVSSTTPSSTTTGNAWRPA